MSCEIIQFSAARPKAGASPIAERLRTRRAKLAERIAAPPAGETETARNFNLRQQMHQNWRVADARREYWKAAWKMESAIAGVQRHDLPEGDRHPNPIGGSSGFDMVAKYREAIMAQLLTPASTLAEVEWKRAAFKAGDHRYAGIKSERIERAIADDVEFLKAHPTRRSLGSNANA